VRLATHDDRLFKRVDEPLNLLEMMVELVGYRSHLLASSRSKMVGTAAYHALASDGFASRCRLDARRFLALKRGGGAAQRTRLGAQRLHALPRPTKQQLPRLLLSSLFGALLHILDTQSSDSGDSMHRISD